ncbi:MAG TPA: siderophore-interacting protein [Microbacterium sp.]|uniref:siderophore-interacting protein n=1 Tax=Microbacterium sp. TaxID=51671 RepID=UPI002CF24213|nr:siderophore-interacting protein [Microbacterium sp.]HWI30754.1 siderophore-interacting protein [Microbacterium sp.]
MIDSPEHRRLFDREGGRHRFTARRVRVTGVTDVLGRFVRVTVAGDELSDFASTGPADHMKVFFPDPESGILSGPEALGPGVDGIRRPDGAVFGRDFTPLHPRRDPSTGLPALDIDIFTHDAPGPAARWAMTAAAGDELILVGPRGSRRAPQGVDRIVLVVDETALPSAGRWLQDAATSTRVELVPLIGGQLDWVESYLREFGIPARVHRDGGSALYRLRQADVDDRTFVFAAGEAGTLVEIRRLLRHELGLPNYQYAVSGYWKQGEAAFDHHAPIDPDDNDDPEPSRLVAAGSRPRPDEANALGGRNR